MSDWVLLISYRDRFRAPDVIGPFTSRNAASEAHNRMPRFDNEGARCIRQMISPGGNPGRSL